MVGMDCHVAEAISPPLERTGQKYILSTDLQSGRAITSDFIAGDLVR
jgi:hypothetical protein